MQVDRADMEVVRRRGVCRGISSSFMELEKFEWFGYAVFG